MAGMGRMVNEKPPLRNSGGKVGHCKLGGVTRQLAARFRST